MTLPFGAAQATKLTADESAMLDEMSRNLLLSRKELEARTGFSKDKAIRLLNGLVSRGLVVKEGSGRGRKYRKA